MFCDLGEERTRLIRKKKKEKGKKREKKEKEKNSLRPKVGWLG